MGKIKSCQFGANTKNNPNNLAAMVSCATKICPKSHAILSMVYVIE